MYPPHHSWVVFGDESCYCIEAGRLGLSLHFCPGSIALLIISVWLIPLLLLVCWTPGEEFMLKAGPARGTPGVLC